MFEALTYQIMLDTISENARMHGILDDTIGILITRPDLPTGKTIMDSLEYYHFRTGKALNCSILISENEKKRLLDDVMENPYDLFYYGKYLVKEYPEQVYELCYKDR